MVTLTFNGDMDFCITIRTMIKKADKRLSFRQEQVSWQTVTQKASTTSAAIKQGLLRRFWYLEDLSRKKDVQRIRACLRNTLFQEETL